MPADLADLFGPPSAREMADGLFRVLIYVRVSSPEQTRARGKGAKADAEKQREREDELSPATQEKVCREWVDDLPEEITRRRKVGVTVFVEAFTSRVLWGRPVFLKVMDEIAAGRVDLLVILKPERLGANSEQQAILRFLLRQKGGDLAYVTQGYEDTAAGRIMATMWAEFNTMRLESLREQFRRRQLARVDGGRMLHSSQPPYGCAWADDDHEAYVFVPETARWVTLIFEWYADGVSKRAIGRRLNDRGVPPPGGGFGWTDRSVDVILPNPIYVGRPQSYRYVVDVLPGLTRSGKLKRRTRLRTAQDEEQPRAATKGLAPGQTPPVSEALWARVQARLEAVAADADQASRGGRPPKEEDDWLLRGGFIRCGSCGGTLECGTTGGAHGTRIYVCRVNQYGVTRCPKPTSISKHLAEGKVWDDVRAYHRQPEAIERLLAKHEADLAGDGGAGDAAGAAAARAALAEREAEARRVSGAYGDPDETDFTKRFLRERMAELERTIARLQREAEELEARAAEQAKVVARRLEYVESVRRIGANLDRPEGEWPPGLRRVAVRGAGLVARVWPSAVRGWQARGRYVEVRYPVDPDGYATLAELLERARAGGTGGSANSHLWPYAVSRKAPGRDGLALRRGPEGTLAVA